MSASDSAKSRMERILRLHEQIDALKLDIRQVYAEEKADGGDKTAMGAAISYIRKREKDSTALAEREAMADVYVAAYDAVGTRIATHTHAPASYSEAKGREYPNDFDLSDNESREMRGFVAGLTDEQKAAALAYDGEDSPVGELTDNQEQPVATDQHVVATAQDDVGATASSTNSNSQRPPPAADTAGEARPSSPVASPATNSDLYDPGPIPAFLDRRQPKAREWETA